MEIGNKQINMKNKKFTFEISINEVPYNRKNAEYIYGGCYMPDFPEQSYASELVFTVLNDAVCERIMAELNHLAECKCETKDMNESQQRFHKYLKEKTRIAKAVAKSYKFVRSEEIS
jgi:hypothetical protein